ncbi:DUF4145 domain-containing protein [Marinoscillum luteum]|uniref:DUF4145 domain-containing protein n=1 Tax=Marinoscillum luteum TaxID=861051 RepID=A0ABW7NCW4_9BACT
MKINRNLWLVEGFSYKKSSPPWPCPICGVGILNAVKPLKAEQSQATIKGRKSTSFSSDNEDAIFRFAGFMLCANSQCNERISIAGNGQLLAEGTNAQAGVKYQGPRYGVFYPRYFEPALQIFTVPDSCPKDIKEQVIKSFSLYFMDSNACANAIRTSLELIMDEQGIPGLNEKNKPITLGARINQFNDLNPKLKPLIEAVKWVGNAGSHISGISKNGILDGYELLQFVLSDLYERNDVYDRLSKKAEAINQSKKPDNQ